MFRFVGKLSVAKPSLFAGLLTYQLKARILAKSAILNMNQFNCDLSCIKCLVKGTHFPDTIFEWLHVSGGIAHMLQCARCCGNMLLG